MKRVSWCGSSQLGTSKGSIWFGRLRSRRHWGSVPDTLPQILVTAPKGWMSRTRTRMGRRPRIGRALRHLGYGFGFETNDEDCLPETNGEADGGREMREASAAQTVGSGQASKANGCSSNGKDGGAPSLPVQAYGQTRGQAVKGDCGAGNGHASVAEFNQLRNEVLSLARRVSNVSEREISEVMAWASEGVFQYSDVGRLTPGDAPKVRAALERLKNGGSEMKPDLGQARRLCLCLLVFGQ